MVRVMKRKMFQAISSVFIWGNLKAKLLLLTGILLFVGAAGTTIALVLFKLSLWQALWWSWTHLLDPGSLSDDKDALGRMVFGSLFSVLGLIIVGGAFITLAEEAARRTFEGMMKGRIPSALRNHTVLAGAGPKLKSFLDALKALADPPKDEEIVIVIPDSGLLDATREVCDKHLRIVVSHIWKQDVLDRLHLEKAKRLVILDNFGGDHGNLISTVIALSNRRNKSAKDNGLTELKLYAEVNDRTVLPAIQSSLARLTETGAKMEVNIMNMADASARLALRQHPLDCERVNSGISGQVILVILGWSPFAEALFWQAVRVAHYPSQPTRIIVVGTSAAELKPRICSLAPGLLDEEYARDIMSVEFAEALSPSMVAGFKPEHIITVAVCGTNTDFVFAEAVRLSEASFPGLRQLLLDLPDGSGYREALGCINAKKHLYAAGSHAGAFELAEKLDETAKKLHERYLKQRTEQGKRKENQDIYESLSDYAWEQLDEIRRGWNRSTADHIEVKLRALADFHKIERPVRQDNTGSLHIPEHLREKIKELISSTTGKDASPHDDVERLAQIEHDRWSAEKIAEGWSLGEPKDEQRKISPYLVAYDKLSEKVKRYDREAVVELLKSIYKLNP